ncbi:hypothetical protein KVR01_006216 [Diaporthe batatas]|uniref:uncharacterized protein n=1 Tax=Diaporthe batatas TaxID=748121 RepID=UPI001D044E7A|nr:uncharacterized protein KVR01_006216 [Diaporthe batatas]KAG8164298.1 hypothetical protein KVR01_006216 [Diaporthe batatas]
MGRSGWAECVLVWKRQVVGVGSHGRMSKGLDGARAKIAEPLDTVRLRLGQTTNGSTFDKAEASMAVKLIAKMRSSFLGPGLRLGHPRDQAGLTLRRAVPVEINCVWTPGCRYLYENPLFCKRACLA